MTAIEGAADLSKSVKGHWVCSLRQIGKWLDRPFEVIPARWTSIRLPVGQLHHARLGVTAKTVANHRANVAAALRWFGKEHHVALTRGGAVGGVGYIAGWYRRSWPSRPSLRPDAVLLGLRSAAGLRSMTQSWPTICATAPRRPRWPPTTMAHRSIARAWNKCADATADGPAAAADGAAGQGRVRDRRGRIFPRVSRRDVDTYLAGLGKMRKGSMASDPAVQPRRQSRPVARSWWRWRGWRSGSAPPSTA